MKQVFSRSTGRFLVPFAAALGLAVFSCPTSAATFSFAQDDWLSDSGGFTSQNSDWGQVDIHLAPSDLSAFRYSATDGTYTGYVNVVTNVQNGATMNWAVQNLPVQFRNVTDLSGSLPSTVRFDLGVTPGVNVTNLGYFATINRDPLGMEPTGSFAAASVGDKSILFGGITGTDPITGDTYSGDSGGDPPPKASNFVGLDATQVAGKGHAIAIKETAVAAIDEDDAGCAPGAVARSIEYLKSINKRIVINGSAQDVYSGLQTNMQTQPGTGTRVDLVKSKKDEYDKKNHIPIQTTKSGDIEVAYKALGHKEDVEVFLNKKSGSGHFAFVSKIIPVYTLNPHDPKEKDLTNYIFTIIDDPTQADHKAENESIPLYVYTNRTIGQSDYLSSIGSFFIENVVPEPSPLIFVLAGSCVLILMIGLRRRHAAR
ncbi:hypothetical protein CCAX7_10820 [Capsulimonas corticalis]|uniref:Uncharacterized protein n=1 Tax=Capsulimonas corticalis TaxID=2219043 RepID=A0A402CUP0_9BACT|nr:hypothetical protein [Capsulimonas corticalis]BDI29031.1 hypothetical protein CCAX7_10820 [Capsulimonas corticalis]